METSSAERISTAINLTKSDRVPIAPLVDFFAARYAGVSMHDFIFDSAKYRFALLKTFTELGPWDMMELQGGIDPLLLSFVFPMKMSLPGIELPEDSIYQFVEEEAMFQEDYDLITRKRFGSNRFGFILFMMDLIPRIRSSVSDDFWSKLRFLAKLVALGFKIKAEIGFWRKFGTEPFFGGYIPLMPFDLFCLARSLPKFSVDIHRIPEKVRRACVVAVDDMVTIAKSTIMTTGVKRVFIGDSRSSPLFISPAIFESMVFPCLKKMVGEFSRKGIVSILHFDTDWTAFLHYLKELPPKSCILELDGFSDIFKAKKILGDRMCLMGDVPAIMLSRASASEVEDYCKRLIQEVGEGGGFILSSGCSVPVDAKPENLVAMRRAVERYG